MPRQCFGKHFAEANSKNNVKCFGIYFGTGWHIAEAKTKQLIKPFGFVQVMMVLEKTKHVGQNQPYLFSIDNFSNFCLSRHPFVTHGNLIQKDHKSDLVPTSSQTLLENKKLKLKLCN